MILQTERGEVRITEHDNYLLITYMDMLINCSKDCLLFHYTEVAEDDGNPYLSLEVNNGRESFNISLSINADQVDLIRMHMGGYIE